MARFRLLIIFGFMIALFSCDDEESSLPSFDERVEDAIDDLQDELTDPVDGWRLDYQPTPDAGNFLILLDFNNDGLVTIRSDVADNDGEFFEQTIPYRIDNALGLELILETYGVFHYLFEQEQGNFGAEFEFIFNEKEGDNLVFDSKSDVRDVTRLTFTRANGNEANLFSREISENLVSFDDLTTQIFGGDPPIQQLILEDRNISVFWSIDIAKRNMLIDVAAEGATVEEINNINNIVDISHFTGYTLLGGSLVLLDPITFTVNGQSISISEVTLDQFSMDGPSFCSLTDETTPSYAGQIAGLGPITLQKSLFDSDGMDFQPMGNTPYSVNVVFVFDGEANSLAEEGSIFASFPNAIGFQFNYGFDSEDQPAYAVGLTLESQTSDSLVTYLREFEPTTTEGNKIQINFTDDFFFSQTPDTADEQRLREITDEIFEGTEMYASDLPVSGATVFRLFNPCNQYELFLVR